MKLLNQCTFIIPYTVPTESFIFLNISSKLLYHQAAGRNKEKENMQILNLSSFSMLKIFLFFHFLGYNLLLLVHLNYASKPVSVTLKNKTKQYLNRLIEILHCIDQII
jgi:hypothetical protein